MYIHLSYLLKMYIQLA